MKQVMYTGPGYVRVLWGVEFPTNQPVWVSDPALVHKASFLDHFVIMDDAPAETVQEVQPEEGCVVPEGWEALHWKQRMKLAKDLMGIEAANGAEADEAIREYLRA